MKRQVDQELIVWKDSPQRKSLLLRGARQVGKTYAARQLGKQFEHFVEINFEASPELAAVFDYNLDTTRIVAALQSATGKKIIPGKTLLFFDELQAAPKVLTALRYFYETMPELHVIAAGSLLDFTIEELGIPVGRVTSLYMYPLSYTEFLMALDETSLINSYKNHTPQHPLEPVLHEKLLRLVGLYLAVGGMPEAINVWLQEKSLVACAQVHSALIETYRQDFTKYAKTQQIKYVTAVFASIPQTIGTKFKYSSVVGEYRKRELAPALDLLSTAGVVHKIYHSAGQGVPLGAQADMETFKLLMLDVALTQTMLGLSLGDWLINPLEQLVNKGPLVEAFVGQELLAYSNPHQQAQLYYWDRPVRSSEAEVDYLIQKQGQVIPLEVKECSYFMLKSLCMFLNIKPHKKPLVVSLSNHGGTSSSFDQAQDERNPLAPISHTKSTYGIRMSTHNYSVHENIWSYPLYAVLDALS